jgi:phospholipid/cholesterol/gamma-HCH transport system ATP-binding protein
MAIENLDEIASGLGHTATQELIRVIGAYISKHFNEVGGFSTRYGMDRFCTLLPYSNLEEARNLAADFAHNFTANGISELKRFVQAEIACNDAVTIVLSAGVAQGKPQVEIDSILATARTQEHKILNFSAKCKGTPE